MNEEMTDILSVMADMNRFAESDDRLSQIAGSYDDGELAEDDLTQVAAARGGRSYADFLKMMEEKKRSR